MCTHAWGACSSRPTSTAPEPAPAASCVESAVHASDMIEPTSGASRAWDQPVLSHSRSMLNEPTAKYRPLGAHATDEIEYSLALDE